MYISFRLAPSTRSVAVMRSNAPRQGDNGCATGCCQARALDQNRRSARYRGVLAPTVQDRRAKGIQMDEGDFSVAGTE